MLSPEEEAAWAEHERQRLRRNERRRGYYAALKQDPVRLEEHRRASREGMARCRERNLDAINARRRELTAEKRAKRREGL